MPPKRGALVQNLRDANPETNSFAIVEEWASKTLQEIEQIAKAAADARAALCNSTYGSTDAEKTPYGLVELLQRYQNICHDVFRQAEAVRTVILIRVPEHKEEDNLGVAAQLSVLKIIDELEAKLLGAAEKSGGGAVSPPAGMYCIREYLNTRAAVEDKLLGSPDAEGGESKKKSRSPSLLLELRQIDADAALKVELAATQVVTALRALINAYLLNWKKLIQPRTGTDHMVS